MGARRRAPALQGGTDLQARSRSRSPSACPPSAGRSGSMQTSHSAGAPQPLVQRLHAHGTPKCLGSSSRSTRSPPASPGSIHAPPSAGASQLAGHEAQACIKVEDSESALMLPTQPQSGSQTAPAGRMPASPTALSQSPGSIQTSHSAGPSVPACQTPHAQTSSASARSPGVSPAVSQGLTTHPTPSPSWGRHATSAALEPAGSSGDCLAGAAAGSLAPGTSSSSGTSACSSSDARKAPESSVGAPEASSQARKHPFFHLVFLASGGSVGMMGTGFRV